jgi:deoxyguanosine kinase
MYYRVHEALGEKIPKPDLVVYLRASTGVLMQRIALRDRPYERNMEQDYIDRLNHGYDGFFSESPDGSPVLTIDTDPLNIIQNPQHLKLIENRIRERLGLSPFQPSLPLTTSAADRGSTQQRD